MSSFQSDSERLEECEKSIVALLETVQFLLDRCQKCERVLDVITEKNAQMLKLTKQLHSLWQNTNSSENTC